MKLTLMIEGSVTALAHILANMPPECAVVGDTPPASPVMPEQLATPTAPVPVPMPAMPPVPSGDDDSGPVNTNAPAFDTSGLPWDERIHAATKTANADGTWKKRRNGPTGAELAAIEAELRARTAAQPAPVPMPQPVPQPAPVPMPAPIPQPVPQLASVPMPAPVAAPIAQPMPAPVVEVAPQPEAMAQQPLDFMGFMTHIQEQTMKQDANGAPMIHTDYLADLTRRVSAAYEPHGQPPLTAITDIGAFPHMIEYAIALIKNDGRW